MAPGGHAHPWRATIIGTLVGDGFLHEVERLGLLARGLGPEGEAGPAEVRVHEAGRR
jgi:hypothetical protein